MKSSDVSVDGSANKSQPWFRSKSSNEEKKGAKKMPLRRIAKSAGSLKTPAKLNVGLSAVAEEGSVVVTEKGAPHEDPGQQNSSNINSSSKDGNIYASNPGVTSTNRLRKTSSTPSIPASNLYVQNVNRSVSEHHESLDSTSLNSRVLSNDSVVSFSRNALVASFRNAKSRFSKRKRVETNEDRVDDGSYQNLTEQNDYRIHQVDTATASKLIGGLDKATPKVIARPNKKKQSPAPSLEADTIKDKISRISDTERPQPLEPLSRTPSITSKPSHVLSSDSIANFSRNKLAASFRRATARFSKRKRTSKIGEYQVEDSSYEKVKELNENEKRISNIDIATASRVIVGLNKAKVRPKIKPRPNKNKRLSTTTTDSTKLSPTPQTDGTASTGSWKRLSVSTMSFRDKINMFSKHHETNKSTKESVRKVSSAPKLDSISADPEVAEDQPLKRHTVGSKPNHESSTDSRAGFSRSKLAASFKRASKVVVGINKAKVRPKAKPRPVEVAGGSKTTNDEVQGSDVSTLHGGYINIQSYNDDKGTSRSSEGKEISAKEGDYINVEFHKDNNTAGTSNSNNGKAKVTASDYVNIQYRGNNEENTAGHIEQECHIPEYASLPPEYASLPDQLIKSSPPKQSAVQTLDPKSKRKESNVGKVSKFALFTIRWRKGKDKKEDKQKEDKQREDKQKEDKHKEDKQKEVTKAGTVENTNTPTHDVALSPKQPIRFKPNEPIARANSHETAPTAICKVDIPKICMTPSSRKRELRLAKKSSPSNFRLKIGTYLSGGESDSDISRHSPTPSKRSPLAKRKKRTRGQALRRENDPNYVKPQSSKSGYLYKRESAGTEYKHKRHFRLNGEGGLKFYKNEQDKAHSQLEDVVLDHIRCELQTNMTDTMAPPRYYFSLKSDELAGKSHYLAAESDYERKKWMVSLSDHIDKHCQKPLTSLNEATREYLGHNLQVESSDEFDSSSPESESSGEIYAPYEPDGGVCRLRQPVAEPEPIDDDIYAEFDGSVGHDSPYPETVSYPNGMSSMSGPRSSIDQKSTMGIFAELNNTQTTISDLNLDVEEEDDMYMTANMVGDVIPNPTATVSVIPHRENSLVDPADTLRLGPLASISAAPDRGYPDEAEDEDYYADGFSLGVESSTSNPSYRDDNPYPLFKPRQQYQDPSLTFKGPAGLQPPRSVKRAGSPAPPSPTTLPPGGTVYADGEEDNIYIDGSAYAEHVDAAHDDPGSIYADDIYSDSSDIYADGDDLPVVHSLPAGLPPPPSSLSIPHLGPVPPIGPPPKSPMLPPRSPVPHRP